MVNENLSKKRIVLTSFVCFIILALVWTFIGNARVKANDNELHFSDDWDVYMNSEYLGNVTLTDYTFPKAERGDTYELKRVLPKELDGGHTLVLLTFLSAVEAYVDDVRIYDFESYRIAENKFIGSGYQFINLPSDVAGKTLTVKVTINEHNPFRSFSYVRFDKTAEAIRSFGDSNSFSFFMNNFVMILGVVLAVAGLALFRYKVVSRQMAFIGMFAFLMGHWGNCYGKLYEVFSYGMTFESTMEYMSLELAPLPMLAFLWTLETKKNSYRAKSIKGALITMSVVFGGSMILHVTNLARFPRTLSIFHISIAVSLAAIALAYISEKREKTISDFVLGIGIDIMISATLLDVIRYNIQKYLVPTNEAIRSNSFVPIGSMMFVVLMIVSYILSLYDSLISKTEKETLTKLAYYDFLTGLLNRAKSKEKFEKLDETMEPVALVSFDVNGLKYVNDTFGHEEGDNLLKTASSFIEKCFSAEGENYRLSGDEFLSITTGEGIPLLNDEIKSFEEALDNFNKTSPYIISVSYGVAYRNAGEKTPMAKLYSRADELMYLMKETSEFSRAAMEKRKKKM